MNWSTKLFLAILAIFAPIKAALLTMLTLIGVDLITALLACKKAGEPITSNGLRRTVIKAAVYGTAIVLGFLTETYLTGDVMPITKIITGYIGLTELLSVLENVNELGNNNLLKKLLEKLNQKS